MVYVVPFNSNSGNLGIVLADVNGIASNFLTGDFANANYPALSSDGRFLAYSQYGRESSAYTLVVLRSDEGAFSRLMAGIDIVSMVPNHTYWTEENELLVGSCTNNGCIIVLYATDGTEQRIVDLPGADFIGNVMFRIR